MLKQRVVHKMLQVLYKPKRKGSSSSGGFKTTLEEMDKLIGKGLKELPSKKKKSDSDEEDSEKEK